MKLNRAHNADGQVVMNPKIVLDFPGWTAQELKDIGDTDVSIENSPALVGDRLYFSNSGGLIHGLDLSRIGFHLARLCSCSGAEGAPPEFCGTRAGSSSLHSLLIRQSGDSVPQITRRRFGTFVRSTFPASHERRSR